MGGTPLGFECFQIRFGLLQGCCLVDLLQIVGNFLALLPGHVIQAVAHHVDDAELNLGFRKYRFDGLREAFESIDAGDEDVLDA